MEGDDKITHEIDLMDTSIKGEEMLNIFKAQEPDVRKNRYIYSKKKTIYL